MKKNYFLLAATTMMFAACAQSDLVNEIAVEEIPQAIEFETFANKATRATENSEESYIENDLNNHHINFIVWGYKNISNNKVFNGVTVSYNNGWDYATESVDKVYWDKTATRYDFYAAAPAMAGFWTLNKNATENNNEDDYITTAQFVVTSHNAASYQATTAATTSFKNKGVTDLMIAAENYLEKEVGDVPANPVDLNFIHIFSRLNVTVKASIDNVTVKNITVGNIKSTGSFNESLSSGDDLVAGVYSRWTLETGQSEGVTVTPTVDYTNTTAQQLTKNTSLIAIEALVIPQSAGVETVQLNSTDFSTYKQPYLYISYDINGENYTQAFNLADVFKGTATTATAVAFNEGWQNTLNIIINPGTIEFEANVAAWDDNTTNTETIQ